jgi:TRAP-type C4-dicarboxylate transport system permease small subunit
VNHPTVAYFIIAAVIVFLALFRTYIEKKARFRRVFKVLGGVEIATISLLLLSLVFFGCLQIVLRNFFHRGIIWADPLMRHIVLWLGCLGGAMATSRLRHINIDVFSRFLSGRTKAARDRIIYFVTALAASVLGLATLKLVMDERAFGEKAFLNVDVWVLQAILPFAFFLIAYRSLLNVFLLPKEKPIDWSDAGEGRVE